MNRMSVYCFAVVATVAFAVGIALAAEEQPDRTESTLLITVSEAVAEVLVDGEAQRTHLSGEIKYAIHKGKKSPSPELISFSLRGRGVKTGKGETGNLSIQLRPYSSQTRFDPKRKSFETEFMVDVHYPLIDRVRGFKPQRRGETELDVFESYTQSFRGVVRFTIEGSLERPKKKYRSLSGSPVEFTLKIDRKDLVFDPVTSLTAKLSRIEYTVLAKLYLVSTIKIQPVFIRYTPDEGCTLGSATTATTGGSFPVLRDRSIEMWSRCCIRLNFLPEVYIESDDYRVLTSAEEADLRSKYDDSDAIEVFFVEVSDPVGLHGGGVTFSIGTANTQIITYDTNLPINLYNLAHELGHAFGLLHPPGNATVGSLLEPSGFCADNPALMSDENCDNASNPLFSTNWPYTICFRNTNM